MAAELRSHDDSRNVSFYEAGNGSDTDISEDIDSKWLADRRALLHPRVSHSDDSVATSIDSSISDDVDVDDVRETWAGKLDFLLSCVGYAVGLGNIWRFPYLCYKNGGGAFLIPYFTFAMMTGVPLFFLDIAFGQFASMSPVMIWDVCPLFRGIGIGMAVVSTIVCIYYNVIIAWTFFFIYSCFADPVPWSTCDNSWNTERCTDANASADPTKTVSPSEEFWSRHVLNESDGIDEFGGLVYPLVICLAIAWFTVFLCLCKGIRATGRLVWVTALFPYVVLIILFCRGVTLDGAGDGIYYYIVPDFEKLQHLEVWIAAATQMFYSLGTAWGSLITMASFNKFNHNIQRDALLVPFINCCTSIFGGFVIFSILGFMAKNQGVDVPDVVASKVGLAFIAVPEAVSYMEGTQFWAILFFLMVFTLGLDSQFSMFETLNAGITDCYPHLRSKKVVITAVTCFIAFLLGLVIVSRAGVFILELIDYYSASYSVMLMSLLECFILNWLYGADRFMQDVSMMIGRKPFFIWKYMLTYISPLFIIGIYVISSVNSESITYAGGKPYPTWAVGFGLGLGVISIVPIPTFAILGMWRAKGTFMQRLRYLTQPNDNWGPARTKDYLKYVLSFNKKEMERWRAARRDLDCHTYLALLKQHGGPEGLDRHVTKLDQLRTSDSDQDLLREKFIERYGEAPSSKDGMKLDVKVEVEVGVVEAGRASVAGTDKTKSDHLLAPPVVKVRTPPISDIP